MSVFGEWSRHLADLVTALERVGTPDARALQASLERAKPRGNVDLTASAESAMAALDEAGLAEGPAPEEFPTEVTEAAHTVQSLARIVLGC